MDRDSDRFVGEQKTLRAMIGMACRGRHGTSADLCDSCAGLLAYAEARLEKCPFGEDKPKCSHCPVHCYQPAMRERIREVMRYAGPRMAVKHPLLAVKHLLRGRRAGCPVPPGEGVPST